MNNKSNKSSFVSQIVAMGFKPISDKEVDQFLKQGNNNVQTAMDLFLDSGKGVQDVQQQQKEQSSLKQIFEKYFQKQEIHGKQFEGICGDKLILFAKDLGLLVQDLRFLYIFSKFNPEAMEVITQNEFITGMANLRCNTISDLKNTLPQLYNEMRTESCFEKMYNQVYGMTVKRINKDKIEIKNAYALQKFLFSHETCPIKTPLIQEYLTYLQTLIPQPKPGNKVVEMTDQIYLPKDTWEMTWQFFKRVSKEKDLEWFAETSHFPTLIDEFMEWRNTSNKK